MLEERKWEFLARLGPGAFETISGEVVQAILIGISNMPRLMGSSLSAWDASKGQSPQEKAYALSTKMHLALSQEAQLESEDSKINLGQMQTGLRIKDIASALSGMSAGDSLRFDRMFWEVANNGTTWEFVQTTVERNINYGGRTGIILWENEKGQIYELAQSVRHLNHAAQNWLRGKPNWGKPGVIVSQTGDLPVTLYHGDRYDLNCCAIVPNDPDDVLALWAYCSSSEFVRAVRDIDQSLKVTPNSLLSVGFDLEYWQKIAKEKYPDGIPPVSVDDPTQWLFSGYPGSAVCPIHVAVLRLSGYRWPRQTGSSFPDCPAFCKDGLESFAADDGIVPLGSIAGEASAANRLRTLLTAAYGNEWSAAKLAELLGGAPSLEDWLRDSFFEEHCQLFHQRPFVWHVWDGRKDGFHALVNYHKLAAPNGEGRKTLEKLIYTVLGDWLVRQRADADAGVEGADGRLAAAEHLKSELEHILEGQKPYDIFIRWKPLDQQPIGWDPDINDGVRLNIRPWLTATPYKASRRDACILRVTPKIKYGNDRGKEPHREKADFPWFWNWDGKKDDFAGNGKFDGVRWNDLHYSLDFKRKARELKKEAGKKK